MSKTIFSIEFEINASPKILYPYISTADGLSKWFADEVIEDGDKIIFVWDEKKYPARVTHKKDPSFIRYEFISENMKEQEPSWIELRLEINEFTQTTFLKIEDFTEMYNPGDFQDMYNHCFSALKEIVGGSNI